MSYSTGANEDQPSGSSSGDAMDGFAVNLSVGFDETDSSLGDTDRLSSNASATPSVYDFVQEFGRTYHKYKEGKYFLPNDEKERDRLNLQHEIALLSHQGKLCVAPVGSPARVLDVGTGTGIWAIEFALQNPSSPVLGTDLSPIQPPFIPPNCRFEIDDIEDMWLWTSNFDFIYGRYITPFLSDLPRFARNCFENLNPGGYIELLEATMLFQAVDGSYEGTAMQRWNGLMLQGVKKIGRDPLPPLKLNALLTEAGFTNVTETRMPIPTSPWPKGKRQKMLGEMEMRNLLEAAHGITMAVFTKALGWKAEDVEVLLEEVREELRGGRVHTYIPFVSIWAQKPE
ncbi:methyltransferase domain-containing protein [Coniochaeta sp. 2T2.1]|nr:methyltransferase domain-containing protein [Coniochaeta sp. 2T2.1]